MTLCMIVASYLSRLKDITGSFFSFNVITIATLTQMVRVGNSAVQFSRQKSQNWPQFDAVSCTLKPVMPTTVSI